MQQVTPKLYGPMNFKGQGHKVLSALEPHSGLFEISRIIRKQVTESDSTHYLLRFPFTLSFRTSAPVLVLTVCTLFRESFVLL